ncbi:MAG TPA: S41 family peptidase [Candidatus Tumulicola sp.]|jgi:C-terminal processing protease CtpA/Prc
MPVRPFAALVLCALLLGAAPAPSTSAAPGASPAVMPAFSVADRTAVLDAAEKALGHYVFQNKVAAMRAVLQQNRARYLALGDPQAFSDAVTQDLYGVAHDKHIRLEYSDEILSPNTKKPSDIDIKQMIQMFASRNFGVIGTLRLRGNIGYLHLGNFGPMPQTKPAIDAAMTMLAHTDAMVIDVRHNGGGDPDSLDYLMGYFYSQPTELTSIVTVQNGKSETMRQFTAAKVSGHRYLGKPLYVLTDDMTFSCAEQFAYDMKSLHRALLIGATTGGGANPGDFVRLSDHFSIFVPFGYARNPYTKTNWEGVGVAPDVATTPAAALLEGYRRALVAAPEQFPQVVAERKKAETDPAAALQLSLPSY